MSLLLPGLTFRPEVEVQTRCGNVETWIDSKKDGNVGTGVRYEKNIVHTRKNDIPVGS